MRLDHELTVPAPIDEVWQAMCDPKRVAPCMPGATLISVEGDTFKGTVKVKLGPISLLYKGSGEFLEKDDAARRITIKASGKDARGAGTAAATTTVTLTAEGDSTKGVVATDLNVTGRPAQFGRGMISEVGGKIFDTFAANLADEFGASDATAPETPKQAEMPELEAAIPAKQAEAIDLVGYAGASVAKRLAPVLAGIVALFVAIVIIRPLRRAK